MLRIIPLFTFLVCSCLFAVPDKAQCADPADAGKRKSPNVLLIVVDDLGYADLGCQGSTEAITPNIDSLAREGIRFTNGYVTAPQCGPSRAGFMTGVHQQRFGFEGNAEREFLPVFGVPTEYPTFASYMKHAGLKTVGVGKWDLGAIPTSIPWNRGFDEYVGFYTGSRSFWPVQDERPDSYVRLRKSGQDLVREQGHMTRILTDNAVRAIREHQSEPFFLYVSYNAPHWPMEPAPEHLERFKHIPDRHRRNFLALLSGVDEGVGQILGTLRELNLDEQTLVVFFSDNGGPTGKPRSSPDAEFAYGQNTSLNTPLRGVKGDVYEGGIRVPFLMRWTGALPAGREIDFAVSSLDVIPTALAAVGAPTEDEALPAGAHKLDGVNLLPYLTQESNSVPHDALYWRWLGKMAIRQGDWKLVRLPGRQVELFDLKTDAAEAKDLSQSHPEIVEQLQNRLMSWSKEMVEPKWRTEKQLEMIRKAYQQ